MDVKYTLEMEIPGQAPREMIIPLVSRYSIAIPDAVAAERAITGAKIKEKMGRMDMTISLAGTAGNGERIGRTSTGAELRARGERLFQEFKDFLKTFSDLGKAYEGPASRDKSRAPKLVFRCYLTGEAYYVDEVRFEPFYGPDAKLIQSYTLNLVADGAVERKPASDFDRAQRDAAEAALADSLIASLAAKVDAREAAIRSAAGVDAESAIGGVKAASIPKLLDELPVRWARFRGPIKDFESFLRRWRSVAYDVKHQLRLPRTIVADLADMATSTIDTLYATWDAIPGADRLVAREWFDRAYDAIDRVRARALRLLGMSGIGPVPGVAANVLAGSAGPDESGYAYAVIQAGESIEDLSIRVFGTSARVPEIERMNTRGIPLRPGAKVRVPLDGERAVLSSDDLFGSDVYEPDGGWVLEGTMDVQGVSGLANLNQGYRCRLTTTRGENKVFRDYGLSRITGEPDRGSTAARIAAEVREQCEQDPRTQQVLNVSITSDGHAKFVKFDIVPIAGDPIEVQSFVR